jgi:hypothetical protein
MFPDPRKMEFQQMKQIQLFPTKITPSLSVWLRQMQAMADSRVFIADVETGKLEILCDVSPCYSETFSRVARLPDDLEDEEDFTVELARLIRKYWSKTKRELCEKALLLENTFYKIQSGKRTPGRDTLICLALALQLNREEANHLLGYSGYALGESYRRDFIILGALRDGKSPLEVNLLLEHYHLKLLGIEV